MLLKLMTNAYEDDTNVIENYADDTTNDLCDTCQTEPVFSMNCSLPMTYDMYHVSCYLCNK